MAAEKARSEEEITTAELRLEELRRQTELGRLGGQPKETERQIEEERKQRELARQREELERRFAAALPEIQQLPRPFITDGYTQPKGREFRRTMTQKGKVSFSALQGSGMLDDDIESVRLLFNGMVPNRMNDRELGSFPGMEARGDWLGRVVRAQELLRDFGPLMVEQGMLAP